MDRGESHFSVALDGTAASGKSTVAWLLAQELNCSYLDTGKLYRAVAYDLLDNLDPDPETWGDQVTAEYLSEVKLSIATPDSGECRILLKGIDVNERLSDLEVEKATPFAARLPLVRAYLLDVQRELARRKSVVMAGRDIGSVVLPDATLKVFIEADLIERARRRLIQHRPNYTPDELSAAVEALGQRDQKDASRECAPMMVASGSLRLDSTEQTPETLVAFIKEALFERLEAVRG